MMNLGRSIFACFRPHVRPNHPPRILELCISYFGFLYFISEMVYLYVWYLGCCICYLKCGLVFIYIRTIQLLSFVALQYFIILQRNFKSIKLPIMHMIDLQNFKMMDTVIHWRKKTQPISWPWWLRDKNLHGDYNKLQTLMALMMLFSNFFISSVTLSVQFFSLSTWPGQLIKISGDLPDCDDENKLISLAAMLVRNYDSC